MDAFLTVLEHQPKLQEFGVSGSLIAVRFGISWVLFDGFCVILHGLGRVPFLKTFIPFVLLL